MKCKQKHDRPTPKKAQLGDPMDAASTLASSRAVSINHEQAKTMAHGSSI